MLRLRAMVGVESLRCFPPQNKGQPSSLSRRRLHLRLDFGLAKRVGGGLLDAPTMSFSTVQGASSVSGTLPYMAPEILRGDAADPRSDLWALGVVLYELASGH